MGADVGDDGLGAERRPPVNERLHRLAEKSSFDVARL
jgi:hypothetical protein